MGVESPQMVLVRQLQLIQYLEDNYDDNIFVLVGHNHPLLILTTFFADTSVENYANVPKFKYCQSRLLNNIIKRMTLKE